VIGNRVRIQKVYKRSSTRSGDVYRIPVLQFPLLVIISDPNLKRRLARYVVTMSNAKPFYSDYTQVTVSLSMTASFGICYMYANSGLFRYQRHSSSFFDMTTASLLSYSSHHRSHRSPQTISTMPSKNIPAQTSTYLEAVQQRRSVYGVTDEGIMSNDRIVEIANTVIQSCPSAWNMQSTRFLITLGQEHKHFWNTVITSAKPFVIENQGEDAWKRNEDRFKSFRAAYGTVRISCIIWSCLPCIDQC
jgi:hypothetical protein